MISELRYSASVSDFRKNGKLSIPKNRGKYPVPVFLSLHVLEEYDDHYTDDVRKVCAELRDMNYQIIADISERSLRQFDIQSFEDLREALGVWTFRIEDGVKRETMYRLAKTMPIVLNASTVSEDDVKVLSSASPQILAMFASYPRPETGLDPDFMKKQVAMLKKYDVRVMAFIPGDKDLCGPLHETLPTLEAHRHRKPSAAFIDLVENYGIDEVYLGDAGITNREKGYIAAYVKDHIIQVPSKLDPEYNDLYDKVFTNRADSPERFIRFLESRTDETSWTGIKPDGKNEERTIGSITVDNDTYGRYSGEVHLMREDLPADIRSNTIGHVKEDYISLVKCIARKGKFMLVK
jgi:hypothetical protein